MQPPSITSPLTTEQTEMLESLLIERFALLFHRETRRRTPIELTRRSKILSSRG
jgi:uncharacterized protein (TIGR03435 family)